MGCASLRDLQVHISHSFYPTVDDISAKVFQNKLTLNVKVLKVIDGDTLRCRHIPYHEDPVKKLASFTFIRNFSRETLYVRITGIDAPEKKNAFHEAQPFAKEATDFVIQHVLNKEVKMTFLNRDQYGRALVTLWLSRRFKCLPPHDLGQLLLVNGLAVIYVGKGAEYNGRYETYKKQVEKAQKKKKGIWGLSKDFETPAEYKRRNQLKRIH